MKGWYRTRRPIDTDRDFAGCFRKVVLITHGLFIYRRLKR